MRPCQIWLGRVSILFSICFSTVQSLSEEFGAVFRLGNGLLPALLREDIVVTAVFLGIFQGSAATLCAAVFGNALGIYIGLGVIMEAITSKENRNIKEYCKLASSKSFRGQTGLFALESIKLVLEAFDAGVEFEKVFVTQYCLEKHDVALQKLFEKAGKCFEITPAIEQKMTGTQNSGGIFAVCKKLDKQNPADTIGNRFTGKYVLLESLQDTGNVGTILRTANALGVNGVILSGSSCDVYSLKVLRAAMGAVFRIPVMICSDTVAFLSRLEPGIPAYAAVVGKDAQPVREVSFPETCILLIGNEGNGLSPETVAYAAHKITIPMNGNAESLNAGMAAGILMWEMMKESHQK